MNKQMPCIFVFIFSIIVLSASCVTIQDKTLPPHERSSVEIIGHVSTKFIALQPFHIPMVNNISKRAYSKLLDEARKKYQGTLEIVNITADGTYNALTLLPFPPIVLGMFSNFQTIKASGDVILYKDSFSTGVSIEMTEAIVKVTKKLAEKIPKDSIIAVLNVFSDNKSTTEQVIGDIEYNMVNSGKFKIVDRRRLDQIRSEQNFQMSGDVSDDSAISIGNMLGANIVITGEISGVGTSKRLILKALDVKTAQITAMEREQL